MHEGHHLHLLLLPVVMAPQHHLAVLPSSGHHGAVLQDTYGEDSSLVGPRHLMADSVSTCRSEDEGNQENSQTFFLINFLFSVHTIHIFSQYMEKGVGIYLTESPPLVQT